MQATDPLSSGLWQTSEGSVAAWTERLKELKPEVGVDSCGELVALVQRAGDATRLPENVRDAVSTRLMEAFKQTTGRRVFGLLYELNSHHLLVQVAGRLRRYASKADPRDVLQEVFFNIYRYPHRFNSEREDAFRVWSAMIVRNTVLKHLRSLSRGGRTEVPFEDLSDQPEERSQNPLTGAIEHESREECTRVYLTYLHLYLRFYSMLSEREQRALHMVEVDEKSYRQAAADLSIKLENLKMVIFRARRKIHRSMRRVFDGLSPDCRPARAPKPDSMSDEVSQ
jgi:RNA polymerase sigma factor (sigma-70 family)